MNEFEIIQLFFQQPTNTKDKNVVVGIGDDAAIVQVPQDKQLVLCMDTLVSGTHFPDTASAADIAYKSLAVNLSDMAAMGATPYWITLSLTTPEFQSNWFEQFAGSFHQLADDYSLTLIGGDLSRGPLSVTVQLQGLLPIASAGLSRVGAKPGDDIFISGYLGAAAYGLNTILEPEQWDAATGDELNRLNRPQPRVELGRCLLDLATSCIDISDGLYSDLSHILNASGVGAEIQWDDVPISSSLHKLDRKTAVELAITGGDDYELCFTLPANTSCEAIDGLNTICPVTKVGKINDGSKLVLKDIAKKEIILSKQGYKHF